jgi:hypothetical protein
MNNKLIKKGLISGIIIFLISEIIGSSYYLLALNFLHKIVIWTPTRGLIQLIIDISPIVLCIFRPISSFIGIFVTSQSVSSKLYNIIYMRALDLLFWIGISIFIIYLHNKERA